MKKKTIDLVAEYKEQEERIAEIIKSIKCRNLYNYSVTAFLDNETSNIASEMSWNTKERIKRFRSFLKNELEIEKKEFARIDQEIVRQFKNG